MASHQAARRAVELGWTKAFVMTDGIQGWMEQGFLVQKG
jgi:rhodanese-related sulfurtransferase